MRSHEVQSKKEGAGSIRILIVEDEKEIVRFVKLELEHEGYSVIAAFDGRSGLDAALESNFDLILLDVMLPELNGFALLRRLRQEKQTPVIMLTAKDDVVDKVTGLDTGASDYMTKPFHIEELLARIRVVLRTKTVSTGEILSAGWLSIDTAQRLDFRDGKAMTLTKTQYDLFEYLLRNKNIVLTREQILNHVWGYSYSGDSNIVDVYVRYVRNRIHDKEEPRLIETVRGVGYVIRDR